MRGEKNVLFEKRDPHFWHIVCKTDLMKIEVIDSSKTVLEP